MLAFGAFSFVVVTFLACVWWASSNDETGTAGIPEDKDNS